MATSISLSIRHIGGPTALLSIDGATLITDPTFDPPGGEYPSGGVTLRKTRGPALRPEQLGRIDVALVSHDQHADNLDHGGRELLHDIPHVLTTRSGAARLGRGAIALAPWQTWSFRTPGGTMLEITATPARHGPVGIEPLSGEVVGFAVRAPEMAEDLVYVTGDTVWFDGVREVARRFQPRVVLLFGGGAQVRGPFYLTMDTNDAVETAAAFERAAIVPVHHEGWAHFTQSQDDLARTFQALGMADRLRPVVAGGTMHFGATPDS